MKNKQKTHKASAKRFRVTKNGKIMHNRQGDNAHLKANKTSQQKARKKGKSSLGSKAESKKIISLLS
jgi:large subunit ribosomal protein L35